MSSGKMTSDKMTSDQINQISDWKKAVAEDFRLLAALQSKEVDAPTLEILKKASFPKNLAIEVKSEAGLKATEIFTVFFAEGFLLDEMASDFAAIYLNGTYKASPNESPWIDEEGLEKQDAMFNIREWYSRYNLQSANWRLRSEDNVVSQLEFVAYLLEQNDEKALKDICHFMDWHLLLWIDSFALRISQRCQSPFYMGLALWTAAYVNEFRDIWTSVVNLPRPTEEEKKEFFKKNLIKKEEPMAPFVPGVGPVV